MRAACLLVAVLACVAVLPGWAWDADASTAWMTDPQHDGELTASPLRPPLAVRWDVRLGTVTSNCSSSTGA